MTLTMKIPMTIHYAATLCVACILVSTACAASTTNDPMQQCGLFLAESSIPNAGWGVYTGVDREEEDVIDPLDIVIQMVDMKRVEQMRVPKMDRPAVIPRCKLREYYWSAETSFATYDALEEVQSVVPGMGMMTNSHPGLNNIHYEGTDIRNYDGFVLDDDLAEEEEDETSMGTNGDKQRDSDLQPPYRNNGAYTHYTKQSFSVQTKIPAGHELFVGYGDGWFRSRGWMFGDDFPLENNFRSVDSLTAAFRQCAQDGKATYASDLWQVTKDILQELELQPRTLRAMPDKHEDAVSLGGKSSAYLKVPNAIRPLEWLFDNGYCMDFIRPKVSTIPHAGLGAFARLDLPKGTVVSPAPLVPISRYHVDMYILEGTTNAILWEGNQLLLNYAYGHPDSSLLLFPSGSAVNLINHATHNQTTPNVKLQWSKFTAMDHADDFERAVEDLLENKTSLVMEVVAIRDIAEGEEILLDYGDAWQTAWDQHQQQLQQESEEAGRQRQQEGGLWMSHKGASKTTNYTSGWTFHQLEPYRTRSDRYPRETKYPDNIEVRCVVPFDEDAVVRSSSDEDNDDDDDDDDESDQADPQHVRWNSNLRWWDLRDSLACTLLVSKVDDEASSDDPFGESYVYKVKVKDDDGNIWYVDGVEPRAIHFVDRPYTAPQYQRDAFRKEVQIPDALFPAKWRDIGQAKSKCGLYMAESSIPNSGLGMFTTREIRKDTKIFSGDVVVVVEDVDENMKLLEQKTGRRPQSWDDSSWLLDSYYWNAGHGRGTHEADDVECIVPGIGMLANSHTGLVNAAMKAPTLVHHHHHHDNPGYGAHTHFHDVHYLATTTIEAGAEIFDEYGDSWFINREPVLGMIPLSADFARSDTFLGRYLRVARHEDRHARDLWNVTRSLLEEWNHRPRVNIALPKDFDDIPQFESLGSAKCSIDHRLRSDEWLEANGRCIDNMKPGRSNNPNAGMGAFATRSLSQGMVISPAPLIHLHRDNMKVFFSKDSDDPDADVKYLREQQLLNYCFGHESSNLLLFPYAPVFNYVNHDGKDFNARLQWSTMSSHKTAWLDRSPDDILTEPFAGLIMELVATRDIREGEEVLIDYGPRWESAWRKHVDQWDPKQFDFRFQAAQLNDWLDWIEVDHGQYLVRSAGGGNGGSSNNNTGSEGDDEVQDLMESVFMACYMSDIEHRPFTESVDVVYTPTYSWKGEVGLFDQIYDLLGCRVLSRQLPPDAHLRKNTVSPAEVTYTVKMFDIYDDEEESEFWIVEGVPRRAIEMFDFKYKSSMFRPGAFRHEIDLPDGMIPSAWRDVDKSQV